jgi:hypothetical protein
MGGCRGKARKAKDKAESQQDRGGAVKHGARKVRHWVRGSCLAQAAADVRSGIPEGRVLQVGRWTVRC